ncbi:MAG: gas vesicle protein GvpD P-loop domain-containing protein [Thermoplasmata archaeon]
MNKPNSNHISIPGELRTFFGKSGGRSLLVKGPAGSGKTTMALQLLEDLADPQKSFYLSSRVSDQALFRQFPWLEKEEMKSRIIDASRILLQHLVPEEPEEAPNPKHAERMTSAREFLRSVSDEPLAPPSKVDRTRLSVLLERNRMPEIERIYDKVESNLPEKSMIIIDSVEGITNKYSLDHEELVTCIQKDLVEGSNADVVFVLESREATNLEYLVDGVVRVTYESREGRRVRNIALEKLRGTSILQPSYLVTLHDGRFNTFDPFRAGTGDIRPWVPILDHQNMYSTGTKDLDNLLGGGYAAGSYNVLEVEENVSNEEYHSVVVPILLNFISQNKGIFAVLSGGDHAETLKKDLEAFLPDGQFEKHVRIADYFTTKSESPYIMALGTRNKDDALRTWKSNQEFLRGLDGKPIMDFTGFDTLEYLRGGEVAIQHLLDAVAKIKISNDLGIGILKPGLRLTQEIMNMADTYLKIITIDKCPCIYGVKPKTMIYGIVNDLERGTPNVKLIPII